MLVAIPLILCSSPLAHSGRVTSVAFSPLTDASRRRAPWISVHWRSPKHPRRSPINTTTPSLLEHHPALTHTPRSSRKPEPGRAGLGPPSPSSSSPAIPSGRHSSSSPSQARAIIPGPPPLSGEAIPSLWSPWSSLCPPSSSSPVTTVFCLRLRG